jgi:hypothetical protein
MGRLSSIALVPLRMEDEGCQSVGKAQLVLRTKGECEVGQVRWRSGSSVARSDAGDAGRQLTGVEA